MKINRTIRNCLPLVAALAAGSVLADEAKLLVEARGVASAIPPKLLNVLVEEIKTGGPEGAIGVCREKAPQMAKAASEQSGWAIRRVSLKNRNPKAVPDAWEEATLKDFDKRAAAGESPASLEKSELVADGDKKTYRYIKALPTHELCMNCHGATENLSSAVKARLGELYPDDKAVGYRPGQIRGAMTLKKSL